MTEHDHQYDEYEIDLREYIMLLWNKKWLIAGVIIVSILAAWVFSSYFLDETYRTEATLRMTDVSGPYSSPQQIQETLRSASVAGSLLVEFGYEVDTSRYRGYVTNNISVNRIDDTDMINLEVEAPSAEMAHQIAGRLTEAFLEGSEEQFNRWRNRRQNELETYQNRREEYNEQIMAAEEQVQELAETDLDAAARNLIDTSISQRISLYIQEYDRQQERIFEIEDELAEKENAEIVNAAYLPTSPVSPRVTLNMAIAAVLAGMIAVFGIFFVEFLKED
ncbi:MAG: Wzz/FepE/Etk N-terminal domain-containing protein [Bacillota bacterium]